MSNVIINRNAKPNEKRLDAFDFGYTFVLNGQLYMRVAQDELNSRQDTVSICNLSTGIISRALTSYMAEVVTSCKINYS